MKDVSCVDQLSFVRPVTNVPTVAQDLIIGARLQKFLENLAKTGCRSESVKNNEKRLHSPLSDPAKLDKVTDCHKLEALHQLMDKNAVELVQNQPTFHGPKTQQQNETYTRSE